MRMKQENAKERCYGSARGIASDFAGVKITKKKDDCPQARAARIALYQSRVGSPTMDIFGDPKSAFQKTEEIDD